MTAALIGFPVLYVVSWGPAWWLVDLEVAPEETIAVLYRPLAVLIARYLPDRVGEMFARYGMAFAQPATISPCQRSLVRAAFALPPVP